MTGSVPLDTPSSRATRDDRKRAPRYALFEGLLGVTEAQLLGVTEAQLLGVIEALQVESERVRALGNIGKRHRAIPPIVLARGGFEHARRSR